ncbi:hypothetical protein C8J56DRAFT_839768 [Mycena floridula]|nr:hypothetical protein C8J56DRAFT_839768 [Mycena floridula]
MAQMTTTLRDNTIGDVHGSMFSHNTTINIHLPENGPAARRGIRYMPSKSKMIYGRDLEIRLLVQLLTAVPSSDDTERARICILGPGGMGKTELALAVANDTEVKRCYSDSIWLSCVQTPTPALLLDIICRALGLPRRDTPNIMQDIINDLHSTKGPTLLLFDNFETPWNADSSRAEVAQILRDIEQIPHVALLLTMRGADAPCDSVSWTEHRIEPLDPDTSQQLYTKLNIKSINDPHLPQLLHMLGYMPLAVTLMARQGKRVGCNAEQLIESFKATGLAMLGPSHGSDRQNSITISIEMSIQSGPVNRDPDALVLLAILSMLPAGATFETLRQWWARRLQNLNGALTALLEASLLEQRDTKFFVHPLICSYILHPSHIPGGLLTSMIDSACNFLKFYSSIDPGEPAYISHCAARSEEEINLQSILLRTSTSDADTIHAVLTLSWHHLRTRPRREVIEHAVNLARQYPTGEFHAETSHCYGRILQKLTHFEESLKQYTLARRKYLEISNIQRAADVLLNIAYISAIINPDMDEISLIHRSIQESESILYERGVVRGLIRLGITSRYHHNYTEAITHLTRARQKCGAVSIESALCAKELSRVHYRMGQNDAAENWAVMGCDELKELDDDCSHLLRILGMIQISKGNYDGAIANLEESLQVSREHGDLLGMANALLELGRAWMKKGDGASLARGAITKAASLYRGLQRETVHRHEREVVCMFYLDQLNNPPRLPTSPEAAAALKLTDHAEDIPSNWDSENVSQ